MDHLRLVIPLCFSCLERRTAFRPSIVWVTAVISTEAFVIDPDLAETYSRP